MAITACGGPLPTGSLQGAATSDLNYQWQPFTDTSVWNLELPADRGETPLSAAGLATGNFDPSDAAYGIMVYFATSTDPVLSITYQNYATWLDTWPNPNPVQIQGPNNMVPPTGSDGSVILVDAEQHYAYEMWQFKPGSGNTATASDINVVDLTSDGIHDTVGLTASGLPGSAGLLKRYEMEHGLPVLHKVWLAVNPALLYSAAVSPATAGAGGSNGADASLHFGDVVALTKNLDVANNECNLSPFIQRIALGLQRFGGIVQDNTSDAIDITCEVGAIKDYIDVDYNTTMWTEFACLKPYLVKVTDPWTGATPGGLGIGGSGSSSGSSGSSSGSGSSPTQLISNTGFESGTSPWSLQTWDGSSQVTRTSAMHHSGSYSVEVHNPNSSSDGAAVLTGIPVTGGKHYTFSAWLDLAGITGGTAMLSLDWDDANGNTLKTIYSSGVSANTSWAQQVLAGDAPSSAASATLYLYSYATGSTYFDDASFVQE